MYLGTSPFKAWGLINPRPSEPPAPQHEASGCFGEDKPRLLPSGLTGAHQEQQLQHPATTGPPLGPHHSPPGPSAASALHLPAQPPPSHSPHTTFPSRTFCGCPLGPPGAPTWTHKGVVFNPNQSSPSDPDTVAVAIKCLEQKPVPSEIIFLRQLFDFLM